MNQCKVTDNSGLLQKGQFLQTQNNTDNITSQDLI